MYVVGKAVRELPDIKIRARCSGVFDMCIDSDTLIIPRYNEKKVLFYRLGYDQ